MKINKVLKKILLSTMVAIVVTAIAPAIVVSASENNTEEENQKVINELKGQAVTLKDSTFVTIDKDADGKAAPDDSSETLRVFPAGSILFVTDQEGDYLVVAYQNKTYYIKTDEESMTEDKLDTEAIKEETAKVKEEIQKAQDTGEISDDNEVVNQALIAVEQIKNDQAEKEIQLEQKKNTAIYGVVIGVIAVIVVIVGVIASFRNKKRDVEEDFEEQD